MAAELRKRLLRDKPTKAEVIALLGEPDMMSERDKLRSDLLRYDLGMWSAPGMITILNICIDVHDSVSRVSIVRHELRRKWCRSPPYYSAKALD